VDFSTRLTRAAALMSWVLLGASAVAVALSRALGAPAGVEVHLVPAAVFLGVGAAVTAVLTSLNLLAASSPFVRTHLRGVRAGICLLNCVWVTGLVSATGGVHGPFWIGYLGVVLFAAVAMTTAQACLLGATTSVGLLLATAVSGSLDGEAAGPLVLVGVAFPLATWFCASLSSAVWELQARAQDERQALELRVVELSAYLERAAAGDLNLEVDSERESSQLQGLSTAFNHTIATCAAWSLRSAAVASRSAPPPGSCSRPPRTTPPRRPSRAARSARPRPPSRAGRHGGSDRRDGRGRCPLRRRDAALRRAGPGRGHRLGGVHGHHRRPGRLDRHPGAVARAR
jgi:hypothetical protein